MSRESEGFHSPNFAAHRLVGKDAHSFQIPSFQILSFQILSFQFLSAPKTRNNQFVI